MTRISADDPNAVQTVPAEIRAMLDYCKHCPMPDRLDLYTPDRTALEAGQSVAYYRCNNGHDWRRGYGKALEQPKATPRPRAKARRPARGLVSSKPGALANFRAHLASHRTGDYQINRLARDILADDAFPHLPESLAAYQSYLERRSADGHVVAALRELWDMYISGDEQFETIKLENLARIHVWTCNRWCTVQVNRDMLVDRLQSQWEMPPAAARATVGVPPAVVAAVRAFEPITMKMFQRLEMHREWHHDRGSRYYTVHAPIAARQAAIDAMTAAELDGNHTPLLELAAALQLEAVATTALYRWYDDQDAPIYYGITGSMAARQTTHAKQSAWGEFASSSTVERFPTRDEALEAERDAIKKDRPIFNRQHNDTPEARARLEAYLLERGRLDLLEARP